MQKEQILQQAMKENEKKKETLLLHSNKFLYVVTPLFFTYFHASSVVNLQPFQGCGKEIRYIRVCIRYNMVFPYDTKDAVAVVSPFAEKDE